MAPRCQCSDLFYVGHLIIISDQANDGHVGAVGGQSHVNREYRRAMSIHP